MSQWKCSAGGIYLPGLVWLVSCLGASSALGAEGDYTVETAVTQGSGIEDERFASGMVTRLATGELFWRGGDLGTALLGVTGVYVRQTAGPGQPSYLSVRGGNPRQLVVELDGLRLSPPAGPGFDFGQLSTEGLDSADVYRGGAAAVYGGGAVTGAVRLNPRQATEEGWQVRGRSLAGSFGTTGLSGAASIGDATYGLRLHGSIRQGRGDFPFVDDQGAVRERVNNGHHRLGAGGTAHMRHEAHRLRLTGWWESGSAGVSGPAEFQQAFRQARAGDGRGLMTLRWEGAGLVEEPWLLVDGYATVGAQQQDYHYVNDESFLGRQRFERDARARTVSATAGAAGLIADAHLARVDATFRAESYRGGAVSGQGDRLEASRGTASLSVADEWLLIGERLSLIGALRSEVSVEGGQGPTVEPLLPALGMVARPHRRLTVRANMARTFRRPDFDELYLETEGVRGNPDLTPERAWAMDLGLRWGAADDSARWEMAYFRNAIDSMILFLPRSAYVFEAQNLYGATTDGLETSLSWQPLQRWALEAGYTYTRAFFDGGYVGERASLPGIPRHRLVAGTAVELGGLAFWTALPQLSISSTVHYRSPINLDNFGSLKNGSAMSLDMGAVAGLREHFRGSVKVTNLLDHRYAQDSLQRPLPGRSVFLSLEMVLGGGR